MKFCLPDNNVREIQIKDSEANVIQIYSPFFIGSPIYRNTLISQSVESRLGVLVRLKITWLGKG